MRAEGDRVLAVDLERHLRATDSAVRGDPRELLLLCDAPAPGDVAPSLDRAALERRVRDVAGEHLRCAWAAFPDDGLVLDDLVGSARARIDTPRPPRHRRSGASRPHRIILTVKAIAAAGLLVTALLAAMPAAAPGAARPGYQNVAGVAAESGFPGSRTVDPSDGTLPFTGLNLFILAAFGFLLLAVGVLLAYSSRKRS